MRIRALPVLVAIALGVPFGASPAQAQGDAVTEMARQRFEEGVKLFDRGDYKRAQAAFLQAWALKKHPAVLLNLAQCELRAGDHVPAARHFAQYLRDYPNTPASERTTAREGLAKARQHTGQIEVVGAAGADVLIDGENVGRAPLPGPIDVAPGTHQIQLQLPGKPPETKQSAVTAGSKNTVRFDTTGEMAPPVPPPPTTAPPPVAPSPTPEAQPEPPPPTAAPPPETPPETAPAESGRMSFGTWVASDPVAWATLGATGLGLGAGITFAFMAGSSADSADSAAAQISAVAARDDGLANYEGMDRRTNPCADPIPITESTDYRPACSQLRDHLDARDSRKTLTYVGFGVAAAGAIGTGIAYSLRSGVENEEDARRPRRGYAAIIPLWSPDVTGLGVTGTF